MTIRFHFYCTCGDSGNGTIESAYADQTFQKLLASWNQVHSGPGHAHCDRKTCLKEARRLDAEDRKSEASNA